MNSTATANAAAAAPYLSINNVEVIYDHVILVLKGVSLQVEKGSIVALLGANGAGKSTTLKSISNLLGAERGDVTKGNIEFKGQRIDQMTPNDLVKRGVIQVMEGRHCFGHLTIEETYELADAILDHFREFPLLHHRCGTNTHHRQQQRFRRVHAMMTSLWRGLCSRLHRPPGCPKPHQCVFDAIGYAGGVRACVDVYYHNKLPSTRVIASTEGS